MSNPISPTDAQAAYDEALRRIKQAEKVGATKLRMYDLPLTKLPPEISHCNQLKTLSLGHRTGSISQIAKLPPEIGQLSNLNRLDLRHNNLSQLPCEIGQLSNLNRLDLRDNKLTQLPSEIGQLSQLRELSLSQNELSQLPSEIGHLLQLNTLDISQNDLTQLPLEINQLSNLKILNLRQNRLFSFPPEFSQLTSLRQLDLSKNGLLQFPTEITRLKYLRTLNLGQNNLIKLPPNFVQLVNLKSLYLGQNHFTQFPFEILQLFGLRKLSLWGNQLSQLPPEICKLGNLQNLYLSENNIFQLPSEIGQLTNLQGLDLRKNRLSQLPSEISQIINLQELDLRENNLSQLPSEISQIINLSSLDLSKNNFTRLPIEIGKLTNLTFLDLKQNPKLLVPVEISQNVTQPQLILDYLAGQMATTRQPLHESKLILVGQGGVGKTSLVQRLLFDKHDHHETQTKGINIQPWSFKDVPRSGQQVDIQLNVWDFGGQEIMHATHQFFMTKRSVYLLVLDARQGEQEGRVEYWLALIRSFAGDSPILIILNKSDEQYLELNRRGLMEKYPSIVGFVRTSARTGMGIPDLKKALKEILSTLDHVDILFPESWYNIKTQLESLQQERNFLPYDTYQALCEAEGISHDSSQRTLIQFLHDLGVLLNFQDDERISDTNILNPEWVTKGVYALITDDKLAQQNGILKRGQLRHLLNKEAYPIRVHNFILMMMEKFELAYPFAGGARYLIPDLLPPEQPDYEWDDSNTLQFQYHYTVLPFSILHRFIVREHQRIHDNVLWRTGVMVSFNNMVALIKADIEDKKMSISIRGDGRRREFLTILRYTFDSLHESIIASKPTEHVPIPNYPNAVVPYDHLLMLEEKNARTFFWVGVPDEIDVQTLLGTIEDPTRRHLQGLSRQGIRELILEGFNDDDIKNLCFLLEEEYDDLSGDNRNSRVISLIRRMEHTGRTNELIEFIAAERPNLFNQNRRFRPKPYRS